MAHIIRIANIFLIAKPPLRLQDTNNLQICQSYEYFLLSIVTAKFINNRGECERGNRDAMLPAVSITPLTLKELLVVLKCLADKVLRLVEWHRVRDIPA